VQPGLLVIHRAEARVLQAIQIHKFGVPSAQPANTCGY
jgi:hypothetical protein